jgi:hypothetical protein
LSSSGDSLAEGAPLSFSKASVAVGLSKGLLDISFSINVLSFNEKTAGMGFNGFFVAMLFPKVMRLSP